MILQITLEYYWCVIRISDKREYLEALGLDEYDPLAIIQKTKGRMAEDDPWMELREIGKDAEEVREILATEF